MRATRLTEPSLSALGRAAVAYAEQFGMAVFPVRPRDKRPVGELVPRGVLDATTELTRIHAWWGAAPTANIGIAMGASVIVALDIDQHGIDGEESLRDLEREHGELPETPVNLTGGGGRHLLFRAPDDLRLKQAPLAPGVDVRTGNGYIVAPPSVHASGTVYCWDAVLHPKDLPFAALPTWIADELNRVDCTVDVGDCPATESWLGRAFAAAGWLVRGIDHTRAVVRCPWEHAHTTGAPGDSSTVLFAPRVGSDLGWFHCSHEHCRHRTLGDVLHVLPPQARIAANR